MNLNSETIFNFYTYKDKNICCQVKVSPKSVKYKNICRCFTQEDWKIFDNELQKLITATNVWNDEKCLKFSLNPYVEVKVQKSELSLKKICKYLDCDKYEKDKKYTDVIESNIVLECLVDFLLEVPEKPKREPQNKSSLKATLSSPLSYEPYTPSKKNNRFDNVDFVKTPGIDLIGFNEESDSSNEYVALPKCKPSKKNRGSSESNDFSQNDSLKKVIELESSENATLDSRERKISSKSNSLDEVIIERKSKIRSSKNSSRSSTESDIPPNSCVFNEIIEETDDEIISQEELKLKDTETNNNSKLIESQEINTQKSRQNKKRSNTVDAHLYKSEQQDRKEKYNHCENKNVKKRSVSIHEIPSVLRVYKEKSPSKDSYECSKINPFKKLKKREERHKLEKNIYDSNENIRISKEENTSKEKNIQQGKKSEKSLDNDKYITKTCLEIQPKESYDEFKDVKELYQNESLQKLNKNGNKLNISLSTVTEPGADSSLEKVKRERNPKCNTTEVSKSLRRSERSPTKPKRFIEEEEISGNKIRTKKHTSSRRSKELFGTDDDDDDLFENTNSNGCNKDKKIKTTEFETPVGKKPPKCLSSSSSSSKKKRKREGNSECEQEKHYMSKWLSKKKSVPLDQKALKSSKAVVKSSSSKCTPKNVKYEKAEKSDVPEPMTIELLSKEEQESINTKSRLMQKENAKLRAELDKMCTSPPKEVEILSLQNIPLDDILNTFSKYKSELDEIFKNNRKKDYIKGHDGINHCFVIRLLPNNVQMKMLDKLTEVYSNENNSTQATLFANALFPEWVIRVYMEKFNFTRQQAMNQITAQEEFRLYVEEQSDNSFMFD